MFDVYSLQHIVWFIAITLLLTPVFGKNTWGAVLALAFVWEVFEFWVVDHIASFPFAGHEGWLNKLLGDPASNLFGFFIANRIIKSLREKKNGK